MPLRTLTQLRIATTVGSHSVMTNRLDPATSATWLYAGRIPQPEHRRPLRFPVAEICERSLCPAYDSQKSDAGISRPYDMRCHRTRYDLFLPLLGFLVFFLATVAGALRPSPLDFANADL